MNSHSNIKKNESREDENRVCTHCPRGSPRRSRGHWPAACLLCVGASWEPDCELVKWASTGLLEIRTLWERQGKERLEILMTVSRYRTNMSVCALWQKACWRANTRTVSSRRWRHVYSAVEHTHTYSYILQARWTEMLLQPSVNVKAKLLSCVDTNHKTHCNL